MATYYIRQSGIDSNAGTSAALAWRTIGKALGASGIASGDTVYIGAGVYRETIQVLMTSATVETKVLGDFDGSKTGDAGEIVWSAYTSGDTANPSSSSNGNVDLNGCDFLTFQYITFIGVNNSTACVKATTSNSTDIIFRDCTFFAARVNNAATLIVYTAAFGVVGNWLIDRCRFLAAGGSAPIQVTLTTGVGSNYDVNCVIQNCVAILCGAAFVLVLGSGASAQEGGGVDVNSCTVFGYGQVLQTSGNNIGGSAFTVPCTGSNNMSFTGNTIFTAGELGAVIDLGSNFYAGYATPYSNVTQAVSSRAISVPCPFPISFGQETYLGEPQRVLGTPRLPSGILGFGNLSGPAVDLINRARPEEHTVVGDTGTATSGSTSTIVQTGKVWGVDQWKGWLVRITGGTGSGQIKRIRTNSATTLTFTGGAPSGGLFATAPASGSTYTIYQGPMVETGKATSGSTTTIVDSGANWSTGQWAGYTANFTGGTGSGQTPTVTSNTATTLTFAAQASAASSTTTYSLYFPGASLTAPLAAVGAFDYHDSAVKEVTTTDAGSVGISMRGPASHEFLIPVDAAATTISVKARYNTLHGTTNKPQAILLVNGEIAVATETKTMTSAVDTWETLTFSSFTPTAKGVVTVRLVSRSDDVLGEAYFDTFTVA